VFHLCVQCTVIGYLFILQIWNRLNEQGETRRNNIMVTCLTNIWAIICKLCDMSQRFTRYWDVDLWHYCIIMPQVTRHVKIIFIYYLSSACSTVSLSHQCHSTIDIDCGNESRKLFAKTMITNMCRTWNFVSSCFTMKVKNTSAILNILVS